jgi:hypothetical protein
MARVAAAEPAGTVVVVDVVVVDGTVVDGTVVVGTVVVVVGTVVVVFGAVVGGTVGVVVPPGTLQAMPFSLQFVGVTPRPAATYPMVIEPPAARLGAQLGALTVTFWPTCDDRRPPHRDEILGARSKVSTQFRCTTAVGLWTVRLAWCPVVHEFTLE